MPGSTRWAPGSVAVWRSVKDGVVDVATPCRVVRDEADLVALYLCPGTRSRRRAGRRGGPSGRQLLPDGWNGDYEERVWHTHRALFLHRPGDAHSIGVFWREADGAFWYWYVNLEAPWRRSAIGFDTWDHALDLVVAPDLRSWAWKDEDEFAWWQEVGIITAAEAAAIRAEGERVLDRIRRRASPFCDGWERWTPDPGWTVPSLPLTWRLVEPPPATAERSPQPPGAGGLQA